jgi:hypothetical protein
MKDIIKLLQDDREYYDGVGKNYLSNSNIGDLLKNPKNFNKKQEDNKNFLVGRYFHQLILEPEKAAATPHIDLATRRGKAYDSFLEENNITIGLLTKEKVMLENLVESMLNVDDFRALIQEEGVQYEVPMVKEIHGEMWKGKADIVGSEHLIDIKTSSSIEKFRWSVRDYNYDSQAYIYQQLFNKPLVFLVIDKTSRMMGMYPVSDESLARGEEKVIKAVEQYRKFYGDKPSEDINQFYFYEEV